MTATPTNLGYGHMNDQITVTVRVQATWTPNLTGDTDYPTITAYATRVREQFTHDPIKALAKLPDPVFDTVVDVNLDTV